MLLRQGVVNTGEKFVSSLASKNWEEAEDLAAGQVLYNIKNRQKSGISIARISDVKTNIESISGNWARLRVMVKTELSSGNTDLLWYELYMKKDSKWKIYKANSTIPVCKGRAGMLPFGETDKVKKTFDKYMDALARGDFKEAQEYLAGRLKQKLAGDKEIIEGSVVKNYESVEMEPVWHNGNKVVMETNYKVNGRKAKVFVTAYKSDNWYITNITSA